MKQFFIHRKLINYIIISCLLFAACNKKRVEQDAYQSMDTFYNKYKQKEQDFVVDTGQSPCLITGMMGTRLYNICDTGMFVRKKDGSSITYPYHIRLVEIYPIKDMILWPLPSIAAGKILETEASIRVRGFKDNDTLVLKPGRTYTADFAPVTNLFSPAQVYDGIDNGTFVDWVIDNASSVIVNPFYDSLTVANMGWVNTARLHSSSSSYATITFSAPGTNPQNIGIFLVFKNFKSVMQVYNLVSGQIPAGETVTLIAMAVNQNNQYLLQKQDYTISANMTIALNMQAISESDLITTLSGL